MPPKRQYGPHASKRTFVLEQVMSGCEIGGVWTIVSLDTMRRLSEGVWYGSPEEEHRGTPAAPDRRGRRIPNAQDGMMQLDGRVATGLTLEQVMRSP